MGLTRKQYAFVIAISFMFTIVIFSPHKSKVLKTSSAYANESIGKHLVNVKPNQKFFEANNSQKIDEFRDLDYIAAGNSRALKKRSANKKNDNIDNVIIRMRHQRPTPEELEFGKYAFNTTTSELIGPFRDLNDVRAEECSHKKYSPDLPTVSVVICLHNEHLITLVRSIVSILKSSDAHHVKEIIVVNDRSDEFDVKGFTAYMIQFDTSKKVKLHTNIFRRGIMVSRIIGARKATQEVLVFLDSHIEVGKHWLEPLLQVIHDNRNYIAVPLIDVIHYDTFELKPVFRQRGGFDYDKLYFNWHNFSNETFNDSMLYEPYDTPTMAGGLFAINRLYFQDMGEYDMGMEIWGIENLEISFRIWQCGGKLKIVPCSRIGHVFRNRRAFKSPNGINYIVRNMLRLANVWMDEYKDHPLKAYPKNAEFGDISDRINLRKRLNCKPFKWYVDNIYPDFNKTAEIPS